MTFGRPSMAIRFAGGGTTSVHFTFIPDSKWTAAFAKPNLNLDLGSKPEYSRFMPYVALLHRRRVGVNTKTD